MKSKRIRSVVVLATILASAAMPVWLAGQSTCSSPEPVLVVQREVTKPGKGAAHERSESAYKAAALAAHLPLHYVGMVSMSGPDRAFFLSWYRTLAAWEDEQKQMPATAALGAAVNRVTLADGDLLSSTDSSVWMLEPEKSFNTKNPGMFHYMETQVFNIKPGHAAQWNEALKLVKDAYAKGLPEAHWAMYRILYGGGDKYVVLTGLKSLGDEDQAITNNPKFAAAMGEDGMKKLDALMAECVESEEANVFRLSPGMSVVSDEWSKEDPEFWTPKAAAQEKKKAEAPKAQ